MATTLEELIHYCRVSDPLGALMLTGEWGIGKTHLIEEDLAEALRDTHVIVRVSLFGMKNTEAIHTAVRNKWINGCSPVLGKLQENRQVIQQNNVLINAIRGIISGVNPMAGKAADLMISMNVLDLVPVMPVIEDFKTHEVKQVVLVFDDLERCKIDPLEMMGSINEYCENQKFHTIIVTNEDYLINMIGKQNNVLYYVIKGKTVCRTINYVPDFDAIISSIIRTRTWGSKLYKAYLLSKKDEILQLFRSESYVPEARAKGLAKSHNLLVLTTAMDDFYRIFSHLTKAGITSPDQWFFSFLAAVFAWKGGIYKDGVLTFESEESEIGEVYPRYSPEHMYSSVRYWIVYGIWDREQFAEQLNESLWKSLNDSDLQHGFRHRHAAKINSEDNLPPETN